LTGTTAQIDRSFPDAVGGGEHGAGQGFAVVQALHQVRVSTHGMSSPRNRIRVRLVGDVEVEEIAVVPAGVAASTGRPSSAIILAVGP
jgi:hypothetical protein